MIKNLYRKNNKNEKVYMNGRFIFIIIKFGFSFFSRNLFLLMHLHFPPFQHPDPNSSLIASEHMDRQYISWNQNQSFLKPY